MDEIQLNYIGRVFEVLVKNQDDEIENVSTATTKEIIFRKPDGNTLTKTALFTTDGTDGYIKYTTIDEDLDTLGIWEYQYRIVKGSNDWKGPISKFRVLRNVD